ncbi:MAG: DUF58 domain-containing protein [Pyrinomonadaceae bacterium]
MKFVFTKLFYALLVIGFVPLSLSWTHPALRWATICYDVLLLMAAFVDGWTSRLPQGVEIAREIDGRFHIGAATDVRVKILNETPRELSLIVKDEYPPEMNLNGKREATLRVEPNSETMVVYGLTPPKRGQFQFGAIAVRYLSRLGLVWVNAKIGESETVKVYPNIRRAREAELKALGARALVSQYRRTTWRGEGRDFESLRDYVAGDELRHVAWTATARRGKLTTRQYQIERDQTILIALDAGRLMTARIESESKFDTAIHAALALMSAAARGGDSTGLIVFRRHVEIYIPPGRGHDQINAVLEALHAVEPQMIEPSYTRAFEYIATRSKRRALVVLLTDLVDEEGSRELLQSLKILRPRHLPLVVTIGDRDLRATVAKSPDDVRELFTQSVAEEVMTYRETALRLVEHIGGLALDVTAPTLTPALLETYLRVKERGLL